MGANLPQPQHDTIRKCRNHLQHQKIKIAIDMAISDAGTTGHFVLPDTPVTNIKPTTSLLTINLPDGE